MKLDMIRTQGLQLMSPMFKDAAERQLHQVVGLGPDLPHPLNLVAMAIIAAAHSQAQAHMRASEARLSFSPCRRSLLLVSKARLEHPGRLKGNMVLSSYFQA